MYSVLHLTSVMGCIFTACSFPVFPSNFLTRLVFLHRTHTPITTTRHATASTNETTPTDTPTTMAEEDGSSEVTK